MPPAFTLGPGVLQAAVSTLTTADSALGTVIAGVAGPTTTVVAPGSDSVSIAQAAAIDAWAATLQTALANGQSYASQFVTNLSAASDTYTFAEASNAAASAASPGIGSGGIIDGIAGLLGGPSGSLNGNPFSLSSNAANLTNINVGNWASATSDLFGMAGGGLLPAGSDTIGDAAASAALASSTTPVVGGVGGFGAMPMVAGMGQGTLVGNLSVPPTWAGGQVTPVVGATATPLQTVGFTGAAPQAAGGTGMAGMPGMVTGGAGRSSGGFGAPRYGVKPIVMPKPATV
jgi:PPE-repeat protein